MWNGQRQKSLWTTLWTWAYTGLRLTECSIGETETMLEGSRYTVGELSVVNL